MNAAVFMLFMYKYMINVTKRMLNFINLVLFYVFGWGKSRSFLKHAAEVILI